MRKMEKLHCKACALVFILLIVVAVQFTNASDQQFISRRCGNKLIATLMMVCSGELKEKRTSQDVLDDEEWEGLDETATYPFRSRRVSRMLIPYRFKRQARNDKGLADECCKKSCNFREMRAYCPSLYSEQADARK